ncbi:MAG: hypothetical protein U0Q16_03235 [Bryobacteraceae bacterium]
MHTITFYSYKGGTGRTLAVANTARFLARCGCRVFVLDFDLEAPGLHYKFPPPVRQDGRALLGLVDFIHTSLNSDSIPELRSYVYEVENLPTRFEGSICLMPAGDAPSAEYSRQIADLRLPELFNADETSASDLPPAIPLFLELKERIQSQYAPDYLLIDSRTGITETGGVAVRLMPDTVVCLVHSNPENLAGARKVLRNLKTAFRPSGKGPIKIVTALARIPEMPLSEEQRLINRVRGVLNESAEAPEETLNLADPLVLHSDPDLQVVETLLFGSSTTANESILLRDYYRLFRTLNLDDELKLGEERRVLQQLAESDSSKDIGPLLVSRRRLSGETTQAPVIMRERLEKRPSSTLKYVLPTYQTGSNYRQFINDARQRLSNSLRLVKSDFIPPSDVRWDLLAVHLREGVLDFCDDLYYLTENRSHFAEIVQLGWCSTFKAFVRKGSGLHNALLAIKGQGFAESMTTLIHSHSSIALGVLGDTPAASETNRRISPLLAASRLVSKGSEQDLLRWLDQAELYSEDRIAICDHVVIDRLRNQEKYTAVGDFQFEQRVPLGIVYPREDLQWRRGLSKAIADSLVEFRFGKDQAGPRAVWDAVAKDIKANGLDALSWTELQTSLLLDMPFEQAVEWDRKIYQASGDKED